MWNYGDAVKVRLYIDGIVVRRVVGSVAGTVHLCTDFEFESAQREDREPIAIGFPKEDVYGIDAEPVTLGKLR